VKSDKEIIQLLESDPNEGMIQLMEQYLKLVHSVASGLKNPEDVKDCINDTFADFYRYRSSFDPSKGSLGNYLAAIKKERIRHPCPEPKAHHRSLLK
jgi:DNA-directed RNA polymerase specialized sigma24 family protein